MWIFQMKNRQRENELGQQNSDYFVLKNLGNS